MIKKTFALLPFLCSLLAVCAQRDRINTATPISNVINDYTPVLAFEDKCKNTITVENAGNYKVNDTVLIIQMKGAVIDSSNSAAFGSIINYKNAGKYEFNYIKSISGNAIQLKNTLLNAYDIPGGKVQLVRVPYYNNVNITGMLTCLPWDGTKGGILVLNVSDTVNLLANIEVTGKGFRGGVISNNPDGGCGSGSPNYYYPLVQPGFSWSSGGAEKGEGIAEVSEARRAGKGAQANGGGGGNKHNTGGGGGSNYATGGKGGNDLVGCSGGNSGIQGFSLASIISAGRIFLGGGGGRGDDNNRVGTVGANGGGIVIIKAKYIKCNGHKISANGASQTIPGTGIADGAGGGGGAGVVQLDIANYLDNVLAEANGGNGGDQEATYGCVGTGGGGGAGHVAISGSVKPPNLGASTRGGLAGIFKTVGYTCTNSTYGATNGNDGATLLNQNLSFSSTPFDANIDSVRINETKPACGTLDLIFNGMAYIKAAAISNWQWFFGDGGTGNTQNTTHTYASEGDYTVKLIATDINGCADSIVKNITVTNSRTFSKPPDATLCEGDSVLLSGNNGAVGTSYVWSPSTQINNTGIENPTVWPANNRVYSVVITDLNCNIDTVFNVAVSVNPPPDIRAQKANDISCENNSARLSASGGVSYEWTPATGLDNASTSSPIAAPSATTTYHVTGTNQGGCSDTASVTIVVNPSTIGSYKVANAFTPNGDGNNDCFGLNKLGTPVPAAFFVYNRWGQKVFSATKTIGCWDGTYKGKPLEGGIYVYIVRSKNGCGNIFQKGTVTLIR
jgi:gliding motility-associated-like protein